MKRKILFISLVLISFLVSGCNEIDVEELLNNPQVKSHIYEIIENLEFDVTISEKNDTSYYHIDPRISGEYILRNSSEGVILTKKIEQEV